MSSLPDQRSIVGNSVALRHVLHQVEIVAPTDATVRLQRWVGQRTDRRSLARKVGSSSLDVRLQKALDIVWVLEESFIKSL